MRTDLSSEIDGALSQRNAGSRGFHEIARSGNGNMRTDLQDESGGDYEEFEGVGEAVEDLTTLENRAESAGDKSVFKPFREPKAGEKPPHPPKPGRAWIRRRIRTNSRRAGGPLQARLRWVQVTPKKWQALLRANQVQAGMNGLGFMDISSQTVTGAAIGGALTLGVLWLLRRKRA